MEKNEKPRKKQTHNSPTKAINIFVLNVEDKVIAVNDNNYLADDDYYEQRYQSYRMCHGIGRYHSDIDKY